MKKNAPYYVYLLRCADGTYYCGITTDVERRTKEHNTSSLGAKYTKPRRPVVLAYFKKSETRGEASKEEARIKKLSRKEKEKMFEK
jgi:putative endonuclease